MNRKSTKILVEEWRRFLSESEVGNKSEERKDPLNADDFNGIKDVNEPPLVSDEAVEGEEDEATSELSPESVIEDYEGDT
jgi:hypothetical protein